MGDHYFGSVPLVLRNASCPFGGGVAGSEQELCGVLAAATLLLGALYGRDPTGDDSQCYDLVASFRRQFAAQNGGKTRCADVRHRLPQRPKRCLPVIEQGVVDLIGMIETARQTAPLPTISGEPTCPT